MRKLKYSSQREAIKNFLASRTDHPTADVVYDELRKTLPNLSLGTVYRNLSLLESLGDITKITISDGADRYDANTSAHNHFICRKCGAVQDINVDSIDHIKDAANKDFDGLIDGYHIHFHGLCAKCSG